jgi:hydrogenase expression/formation protein HypC
MCLAIPMKLLSKEGDRGTVDLSGVHRQVMLSLVPSAEVGDYVIVHAGYALEILDEADATKTLELLREMGEQDS